MKPCANSKMEVFVIRNRQWLKPVVNCCYLELHVTGLLDWSDSKMYR